MRRQISKYPNPFDKLKILSESKDSQILKYPNIWNMQRTLYLVICLFVYSFICLFTLPKTQALAQSASQSGQVNIQVTLNGFLLSISGYLAPYASITLTSTGTVFASTTADAQGNFFLPSVKVAKGFTTFCLDGIDYKRLGESEACFTIPPITGPYSKSQIFLPPTLGVFRTDVNVGNNALVFGYGMPGALISIKLDSKTICEKTADEGGYYECNFAIQKEGSHEVYADSTLHSKASEPQLKRILIKGIGLVKLVTPTPAIGRSITDILFGLPGLLIALFFLLLLIILLIIWLKKLHPVWLPRVFVPNPKEVFHHGFDSLFRERKLHHWWIKGIGY